MESPLSQSPSQFSWPSNSQFPGLSSEGSDDSVDRRRPGAKCFVRLSDDESETEQLPTSGASETDISLPLTMQKAVSSRTTTPVTPSQPQKKSWLDEPAKKSKSQKEATDHEQQDFTLLPSKRTLAQSINWNQLLAPCQDNMRENVPAALSAREQAIYLQRHLTCLPDMEHWIDDKIATVSKALQEHLRKHTDAGVSTHSEYLTILCQLHNESACDTDQVNIIEFNRSIIDPESLTLGQLKRLIPLYHSMVPANRGALHRAHNRIGKELILKMNALLETTIDRRNADAALQILLKDLLPLLVVPSVSSEIQELLKSPIIAIVYSLTLRTSTQLIPLYQQLNGLLTLAIDKKWIDIKQAKPLFRKLSKSLNNQKPFGSITERTVSCSRFLNLKDWHESTTIIVKTIDRKWRSLQQAFQGIDCMVMDGCFLSALVNCCGLWHHSLLFINPSDRQALQLRLNHITRILVTEMYSAIEESISERIVTQQLEWLLKTLGDDAWNLTLTTQVKAALTYLAQTVVELQLPENEQEMDISKLIAMLKNARSICDFANIPPKKHLQKQINVLVTASQLNRPQKQALQQLLAISDIEKHYLSNDYLEAAEAIIQNDFSRVTKVMTTIKQKQLEALYEEENQTTSPSELLAKAYAIAGTSCAGQLKKSINQLCQKLTDFACQDANQKIKEGNEDDAIKRFNSVRSLPGLNEENLDQLRSVQARIYLLQSEIKMPSLAPLLPDLEPLIHQLVPRLNPLGVSCQDYFSQAVKALQSCAPENIPDQDAVNYCQAFGRLASQYGSAWDSSSPLYTKFTDLKHKCENKAEKYKKTSPAKSKSVEQHYT